MSTIPDKHDVYDEPVESRDIAVIGLSGAFPQAKDPDQFWENLKAGRSGTTFFTDGELLAAGAPASELENPNYIKAGAILDNVEGFDARFFGFNPKEAQIIDPQQRLFLEHAWHTLENAGYAPEKYDGLIGVYAGVAWNTYLLNNLAQNRHLFDAGGIFQVFITNDKDFMSTRISYKLNLKGPSMIIQTSCSTSLVAVHMACLSLLNYECDIALAGGVTVKIPQVSGYHYIEGGLASPDGYCRAFDADAKGTIFGSGIGIVALKRLAEALEDGDMVLAVIKGSAVNNDGSAKVSYTAPSVEGQAGVIAEALEVAGVEPDTIDYVEAHGTATSLGDPIEVTALSKVFRSKTQRKQFCALGSVKSNVGHLDAAAGITGFIKTVLALQHKQIPPSLHYKKSNPAIDFNDSPFYVNTVLKDWETNGKPRRAGVSSFGVGGTNAHVILEEAPEREPSGPGYPAQLFIFSAKTETALKALINNVSVYIRDNPGLNAADIAYTLAVSRTDLPYRKIFVGEDAAQIAGDLDIEGDTTPTPDTDEQKTADKSVVFMLPGHSADYVDMAQDLYHSDAFFRDQINFCCEYLKPYLGSDLRTVLYPTDPDREKAAEIMKRPSVAQPVLFLVEYALAKLLINWGIQPAALVGHGIGEYVAACLSGVFSLEDGLLLAWKRGRVMEQGGAGTLLQVALPEQEVAQILNGPLLLKAVNGPAHCVVSGPDDAINSLEKQLSEDGIICRKIREFPPYHTLQSGEERDDFVNSARSITHLQPEIPYLSNLTGTWISHDDIASDTYWVDHLDKTIRFADNLAEIQKNADHLLLEIGPDQTLSHLALRHPHCNNSQVILSSLFAEGNEPSGIRSLLHTLGTLWLNGVNINWNNVYARQNRRRLALPGYPFEREKYWIAPDIADQTQRDAASAPGKTPEIKDWFYVPLWKPVMPPAFKSREGNGKSNAGYLIFADQYGLAKALLESPELKDSHYTVVYQGKRFEATASGDFILDPLNYEDYQLLIKELTSRSKTYNSVIHLWGLTDAEADADPYQFLGYYSLLYLVQVLSLDPAQPDIQLTIIANQLSQVFPRDGVQPEKSLLLGLHRVIPQEYLNITSRSIDIELPQSTREKDTLISRLLLEVHSPDQETMIAYRNQKRYRLTYDKITPPVNQAQTLLRHGGTYLITGGLEGIGLILARYLAQTYKAQLIFFEPGFPDNDQWDTWQQEHEARNPVSRKIEHCKNLETYAAAVNIITCELSDTTAIINALEQFPNVHGVIHAASVTGEKSFRVIRETGPVESNWHFDPKVRGTINLFTALKNYNLDFCILSSSLTSVLGGRGYVAYTAANIYQDSFINSSRYQTSFPCIAIDWDVWEEAQEKQSITSLTPELARYAMTEGEAIKVFELALSIDTNYRLIISTGDLNTRLAELKNDRKKNMRSSQTAATPGVLHPRPELATPFVKPSSKMEKAIAGIWQHMLGFKSVGIHDNFFELGGDSLIAMQLVDKLNDTLQIDLEVAKLYQGLTIEALARIITEETEGVVEDSKETLNMRKEKMNQRKQFQMQRRSQKGQGRIMP